MPGKGTLAVSPKTTTVLKNGEIALLLKGTSSRLRYRHPASDQPGRADPGLTKPGTASFATTNNILSAK